MSSMRDRTDEFEKMKDPAYRAMQKARHASLNKLRGMIRLSKPGFARQPSIKRK